MMISWTEKLTYIVVLEKVGSERQLLNTVRWRQWKFIGHELKREGGMEKNILQSEIAGKEQEEDKN